MGILDKANRLINAQNNLKQLFVDAFSRKGVNATNKALKEMPALISQIVGEGGSVNIPNVIVSETEPEGVPEGTIWISYVRDDESDSQETHDTTLYVSGFPSYASDSYGGKTLNGTYTLVNPEAAQAQKVWVNTSNGLRIQQGVFGNTTVWRFSTSANLNTVTSGVFTYGESVFDVLYPYKVDGSSCNWFLYKPSDSKITSISGTVSRHNN